MDPLSREAFKSGIPDAFLIEGKAHTTPVDGDGALVFVPPPGREKEFAFLTRG